MFQHIHKQLKLTNSYIHIHTNNSGLLLTDLTFIGEGNPDPPNDGLLHFGGKRAKEAETILGFQKYQAKLYDIKPNPTLLSLLSNLPTVSDEALWEQSSLIEPKELQT